MKINKKTFIALILNLIIIPLLGNEHLINLLHLNLVSTILFYLLPVILSILIGIDWLKSDEKKLKINIERILFIIFIIILTASLIFSKVIAVYTFSNYIKLILMLYLLLIMSIVEFNDEQKKVIDYSIITLLIVTSIYGICQYIFDFETTLAGIEKYPGATGRVKSTFYIATIFDKYLIVSLLYSIMLFLKNRINKYYNIIAFIIGNLALIFTFCRTSLIIILTIYFIFIIYSIINKKYYLAILILLTIISSYFVPGQKYLYSSVADYFQDTIASIEKKSDVKILSKISDPVLNLFIIEIKETDMKKKIDKQLLDDIDYSIDSRKYYRNIATNIMLSNPMLGIGIGSYNYVYDNQKAYKFIDRTKYDIPENKYQFPHCMYAHLGAEIGIIGMIIFFLLIIYMLIKGKNIYSYLLLLIILLSCYSESIFYMKDVAYFTLIISALFSNKKYIEKNIEN